MDAPKLVSFKKRQPKERSQNSIRGQGGEVSKLVVAANESKEADEEGEEGVDTQSLLDKKLEQKLRQRQPGVDAESINKSGKASITANDTEGRKSLQSVTGKQFSSRKDDGLGSGSSEVIPHEQLLEKYVEERLGERKRKAGDESAGSAGFESSEDKLYRVPAELKVGGAGGKGGADDASASRSEVDVGLYSGIAEVALPQSFKKRAYEDLLNAMAGEASGPAIGSLPTPGFHFHAPKTGPGSKTSNDTLIMREFIKHNR